MGATDFFTVAQGKTAEQAFASARSSALHEHGHGGYTGSIAEKHEFKLVPLPKGRGKAADRALKLANALLDGDRSALPKRSDPLARAGFADFPDFEDKYGPAGCIKLPGGLWLFFGMAAT